MYLDVYFNNNVFKKNYNRSYINSGFAEGITFFSLIEKYQVL